MAKFTRGTQNITSSTFNNYEYMDIRTPKAQTKMGSMFNIQLMGALRKLQSTN
jgi:hypothetical protein